VATSDALHTLERELRGVFGARLQSLVAYGAHSAHGGAHASPIRTMALVESLTEQDLRGCAARTSAWHASGLATPLLVPAAELPRSLDVFPLEFSGIIAGHTLVAGADPFAGLVVDSADLRRACEVQARSHLLHLREGFVDAAGNPHALAVLIVESAAPLTALLSSLARLEWSANGLAERASDPEAAGRHAERLLGVPGGTITDIVKLTKVHEIPAAEAERLFPTYLAAMERLVGYVDSWTRK
jgi:hypothetical protein